MIKGWKDQGFDFPLFSKRILWVWTTKYYQKYKQFLKSAVSHSQGSGLTTEIKNLEECP